MKHTLSFLFLLSFLAACGTPNQVPIPITQGPTPIPVTSVAPLAPATVAPSSSINAPVVASPGLASIHMIDEKNGWGITDTKVVRTDDSGVTWYDVTPPNLRRLVILPERNSWMKRMHGFWLPIHPIRMRECCIAPATAA